MGVYSLNGWTRNWGNQTLLILAIIGIDDYENAYGYTVLSKQTIWYKNQKFKYKYMAVQ